MPWLGSNCTYKRSPRARHTGLAEFHTRFRSTVLSRGRTISVLGHYKASTLPSRHHRIELRTATVILKAPMIYPQYVLVVHESLGSPHSTPNPGGGVAAMVT